MSEAAGTDIQLALLALGDDVVEGLKLALGADEEAARIGVDAPPIDIVVDVEAGFLDHPVQDFRAHVAVGVGLVLAHVDLVADAARGAGEEAGLEVGVEVFFPDRGEGAQVAIGTAAFASRNDDVDVALRIAGGKGARSQARTAT